MKNIFFDGSNFEEIKEFVKQFSDEYSVVMTAKGIRIRYEGRKINKSDFCLLKKNYFLVLKQGLTMTFDTYSKSRFNKLCK